jgi:transcription elongation GreA/GreB family factor
MKDKITDLEDKIKKLQEIYKDDIGASYKEAQQTQEMIHLYQTQLELAKKDKKQTKVKFFLKSDVLEIEYTVQDENPNPRENIITKNSELGKSLLEKNIGESIFLNKEKYEIANIQTI